MRTVYGEIFESQPTTGFVFYFDSHQILKTIRSSFVIYGDIDITSISGEIYKMSSVQGVPGALVGESENAHLKADISGNDYRIADLYFSFDKIALSKNTDYVFLPKLNGYTYDVNQHIAWIKSWPNQIHGQDANDLVVAPYECSVISSKKNFINSIGDLFA